MQDKKVMEFETFSPEETLELGRKFGREAQPGEVYTLIGDLGVGKTVFTQGIAQGLGIEEPICSPTFTIVQVYEEVAGVAVTENDNLLGEYTINYKKTHSQTLLPMLDEVAKMIELDLNTIDVIAVSAGPGSFTGLRIGSATAKGLALALNKQIVSVPTVDALAYNLWGCEDQVCPLMDARRQQAYTGLYTFSDGQMQTLLPQCAVGIDEITAKINESGKKTVFLGDGVPVFADYLKENLQVPYLFAPAHCNKQRAACVAVLGGILYRQGKAEDAAAHKPDYLRLSQAERERQEKARDFRI